MKTKIYLKLKLKLKMVYINIVIAILFFVEINTTKENKCLIKMSKNSKMSLHKDELNLIYNQGVINSDFVENSFTPYKIKDDVDIEYFYIYENKLADAINHDKIVNI